MDKHNQAFKVSVETGFTDDGSITQCVRWPHSNQHIVRQVINTQEKGIREALIKLGWTPPGEVSPDEKYTKLKVVNRSDLQKLCETAVYSMERELRHSSAPAHALFLRAMAQVLATLNQNGAIHYQDNVRGA